MRRLRATLLLRGVLLACCVVLLAAVLLLGLSTGWTLGSLALAATVWLLGIEAGVLPLAIEYFAGRRAATNSRSASSIWFVDLAEQERQELRTFHDDTSDNPTVR
ncbi:MAG: hypothetical protein WAT39_01215 [Planctomycetota bacterium]